MNCLTIKEPSHLMKKDRTKYKLTDFLTDESFKSWVLDRNRQNRAATDWDHFLEDFPHLKHIAEEAVELITVFKTTSTQSDQKSKEESWAVISSELGLKDLFRSEEKSKSKWLPIYSWMGGAASLVLIAISFFYIEKEEAERLYFTTKAGEFKEIYLPDSSRVILGGDSELQVENWSKDDPREIWLSGNAHLEVNHKHQVGNPILMSDRFLVHLPDSNIVEVLGTTFNISRLDQSVLVELLEGSIQVSNLEYRFLMKPGEYVRMERNGEMKINQDHVFPLWDKRELRIKSATADEIFRFIRNHYKVDLTIPATIDQTQELNGVLPLDSPQNMIASLSLILGEPILIQ